MKQIKIKDNEIRSKEDFSIIPGIINAISDKSLEQLEKDGLFIFPEAINESDDITGDQFVIRSINECYCSSNVMGFLGCGDERLTIQSRFNTGDEDYLFQYLLERVLDCPNILNLETDASREDRIHPLLIFLFPTYLISALRKGVFKTYVHKEYNDENVKGIINVDRHIRSNVPFVGKIAYSQREYVYNNYLVQLVRHTIEYIKRKPYGHNILAKSQDEVKVIIGATPDYDSKDLRKVILENKKNTVRHAFYHEYRRLQNLCLLILQNENPQISYGSKKVFGILFDGAWLWEEYMGQLLNKYFYHPMNKAGKGAQWLFSNGIGNEGLIYPDFIGSDSKCRIIADAKYKPDYNIKNKDFLQVLAYMLRFEAYKGYYLYPEVGSHKNKQLWLNCGVSYEKKVTPRNDISVIKCGLKIPTNANSYTDFVSMINASETEFINSIISNSSYELTEV